jgi:hypothetical protein
MNLPSDNPMSELTKAHKQAVIITLAQMALLIVFFNGMELTRKTFAPFNGFFSIGGIEVIRIILLVLALCQIIVVWFLRRSTLNQPLGITKPKPFLFQRAPFSEPIQRLYIFSVMSGSFASAIGIYGLVLFYLDGNSSEYYPFAAISLLMFLIYWPRFIRMEKAA